MQDIQEIFDRVKKFKADQKVIRDAYKSELSHSSEYQEVKDEIEKLKIHKKEIESTVKSAMIKDFEKLEDLKLDIDADNEMISDLAFNRLIKGEKVEILDELGNKYDPIIIVKFQKVK
ncbi:MAG: hypothetical protein NTZ49_04420 [Candidatus Parcubacteria bacterium]|nr:hypothetical protein [Candidatus Parcubacteria bacterium]